MQQSLYGFIWRSSRRQQMWLVLLTLLLAPMNMIPLELQRRIVDDAIHNGDLPYMLLLCGAYLVVLLLQGGLKYLLNVYRGSLVEKLALKLRAQIFSVLVDEPIKQHKQTVAVDKGAVVSMTSSEVEQLAGFAGDAISLPLLQAGTACATLAYLFWVQPEIAAFAIALFIPQLLIVPMGQRRINRWGAIHARLLRKLGATIVSADKGTLSVRHLERRFGKLSRGARTTRILIYRVKFFLTFLGNLIEALGPLIVLAVGGWLVLAGKAEIGTLIVFISGFQKIADPWDQLVTFYRTMSNARTTYRLIAEALADGRIAA